jgi:hypothetical protein
MNVTSHLPKVLSTNGIEQFSINETAVDYKEEVEHMLIGKNYAVYFREQKLDLTLTDRSDIIRYTYKNT